MGVVGFERQPLFNQQWLRSALNYFQRYVEQKASVLEVTSKLADARSHGALLRPGSGHFDKTKSTGA